MSILRKQLEHGTMTVLATVIEMVVVRKFGLDVKDARISARLAVDCMDTCLILADAKMPVLRSINRLVNQ